MDANVFYALGATYFLLAILKILFEKKLHKQTEIQYSKGVLLNINRLEQREPSNKPPIIFSIILMFCSFLLLAFGVWAIWSWFSGMVKFNFDLTIIAFLLFFVVFPLAAIIDTFFLDPKRFKLGRSLVAKEANVDFDLEINAAFEKCLKALMSIDANVIKFDKPKYLTALANKSKITVSLRRVNYPAASCGALWEKEPPHPKSRTGPLSSPQQAGGYPAENFMKGLKSRANIICDSQWLTVKFDVGANRKYLNQFLKAL